MATDGQLEGTTSEAPRDLLGAEVCLPFAFWPGYENTPLNTKRRCRIEAFAPSTGQYIVHDTIDGHYYAFTYEQMARHFTQAVRKRAEAASTRARRAR